MVVEPPKSDKRRSVVGGTQRQSSEARNRIEAARHFELAIFETTMFRLSHAKQSRPHLNDSVLCWRDENFWLTILCVHPGFCLVRRPIGVWI